MTKDDAAAVCEALSAESISCLMLTSDCLQSEKEDTMLAWEERDEQCMVHLEESARQDRIMIMQQFTSSTLDMIRQETGTSNVDLMISRWRI